MKWVSAISDNATVEGCVEEVADSILKQLDGLEAHLIVVFVSPHFQEKYNLIPFILKERIVSGVLIGCSGGGIIGGGREVEQTPALSVTAAHLPGVTVEKFYSDTLNPPSGETAPSVWRDWLGVKGDSPHFILLADPFSFKGEEVLGGMDYAWPKARKVGGLASGAHSHGGNALYLNDKTHNKGMVGVALSGNIQLDTIVAQGCRPIGKPMNITKCRDTLLEEVNGTPPLKVLEEMLETLSEHDRKLLQTALFVGIEMDPMKDDPGQGDFLIRNLMGVDRATGSLSVGTILREGQLIQFHLRDKVMSSEDLNVLLTKHCEKSKNSASGALMFSCMGRGEGLYGEPDHDSNIFKEKMGDVPIGGFFCNGEIGPVGATTFLHGYTSSFGIFSPNEETAK
jgi:small ligand-binding sensory domain FIST